MSPLTARETTVRKWGTAGSHSGGGGVRGGNRDRRRDTAAMISSIRQNSTVGVREGSKRALRPHRMRVDVESPSRKYARSPGAPQLMLSPAAACSPHMSYGMRAYSPLAYAELLKGRFVDITIYGP